MLTEINLSVVRQNKERLFLKLVRTLLSHNLLIPQENP